MLKKNFNFAAVIFTAALTIGMVACNRNEMANLPNQKAPAADFEKQPYTYLQNKYIDQLLYYEFKKQGEQYDPEKYSYDEKREIVEKLGLEKEKNEYEETKDDIEFYEKLEKNLMSEINKHFYVRKFVERFAIKEFYDENDMMVITGYDDTDVIAKFHILYCYEVGFDVYEKYLKRETLTGEEEWDSYIPFPPLPKGMEIEEDEPSNCPPIQKAVRYILHYRWFPKIEWLSLNASSAAIDSLKIAMSEWRKAADYSIVFSEITKNIVWRKTCWVMGWQEWFIRIRKSSSNTSYGTLGCVPWADLQIMDKPPVGEICLHELGHILGLHHEHQRADRNTYVTYYPDSIESGAGIHFIKLPEGSYNYYGSKFDFESIMIYRSWTFGKFIITDPVLHAQLGGSGGFWHYVYKCCHTATPLLKKDGTTFEDNKKLSASDKEVIKKIYKWY